MQKKDDKVETKTANVAKYIAQIQILACAHAR